MRQLDRHVLLSNLWLFILLNVIFRDFHQLGKAWYLVSLPTGYQNGVEITDEIMLMAASSFNCRSEWCCCRTC